MKKLRTYLDQNKMTVDAFAEQIGKSRVQAHRYLSGTSKPTWKMMGEIERITEGAVRAADWFEPEGEEA